MISTYSYKPTTASQAIHFAKKGLSLNDFEITTHSSFNDGLDKQTFLELQKLDSRYDITEPSKYTPLKICRYSGKIVGFLSYAKKRDRDLVVITQMHNLSKDYVLSTKKQSMPIGVGTSLIKDLVENDSNVTPDTKMMVISLFPTSEQFFIKMGFDVTCITLPTAREVKEKVDRYINGKS